MQRIRDQRERAGDDLADDLCDRQPQVDRDGGEDPAVSGPGIDMMVVSWPMVAAPLRFVSFQDRNDLQRL